jgi:hypothetical protein
VRDQFVKESGVRNREKTLTGLQVEPLHDVCGQRFVFHRESWRHRLGKGGSRYSD